MAAVSTGVWGTNVSWGRVVFNCLPYVGLYSCEEGMQEANLRSISLVTQFSQDHSRKQELQPHFKTAIKDLRLYSICAIGNSLFTLASLVTLVAYSVLLGVPITFPLLISFIPGMQSVFSLRHGFENYVKAQKSLLRLSSS